MAKISYNGILYDSDLEINYHEYLESLGDKVISFIYHPKNPIHINSKNTYTPDFIVVYDDRVEIIETKGYNQYSFMRDNMIHNVMLEKKQAELIEWLKLNGIRNNGLPVVYKKIKYLKAFGFVDFDFKNPNTIANKRKEKITELEVENKELKKLVKDYDRYFKYLANPPATKKAKEWMTEFSSKNRERLGV